MKNQGLIYLFETLLWKSLSQIYASVNSFFIYIFNLNSTVAILKASNNLLNATEVMTCRSAATTFTVKC